MLIGYARVSTQDQHLELQLDALNKAGCEKIFTDKVSGSKSAREGLDECLNYIRKGDTLVVWKLDRLGRSLQHLLQVVNSLKDRGVEFRSLQESIDTSTPAGKLFFHMFAALAEFERDVIRERTNAGLAAARARGRNGGRPKAMDDSKLLVAKTLYDARTQSVADICKTVGISRATFYRHLNLKGEE